MNKRTTDEILETHPQLEEFMIFLRHLNDESERGQVLVCSSMLDDLLMRTIEAFLVAGKSAEKLLSGFNAPIGSFSARIEASHALGLVSDSEHHDLHLVRKIRNLFAHTLTASFSDRVISDRCRELQFRAKDYDEVKLPARSQFSTAATALILNLTNRPHYVSEKRLVRTVWPY